MKQTGRRILIVEDEPIVADMVAKILDGPHDKFSTTGSIKETEKLLSEKTFDLMILDRLLPDGDGVQLFRKLKESPSLKQLPVLILSGKDYASERVEGLELGADDYLAKPFSPLELRVRVEALLRRAGKPAS